MSDFSEFHQSLFQGLENQDLEIYAMLNLIISGDMLTNYSSDYLSFIKELSDYLEKEGKNRVRQVLSRYPRNRWVQIVQIGVESDNRNIQKEALILASQLLGQSDDDLELEMEIYKIIEPFLENNVDNALRRPAAVALNKAGNWLDEFDISIRSQAKTILQSWVKPSDYHNHRLSKIIDIAKEVDVKLEKQISQVRKEVITTLEKDRNTYEEYDRAANSLASLYQEILSLIKQTILQVKISQKNPIRIIKDVGFLLFVGVLVGTLFFLGAWIVLFGVCLIFIINQTISQVILLLYLVDDLVLIALRSIVVLFAFVLILRLINWLLTLIITIAIRINLIYEVATKTHKIALITIGIAVIFDDFNRSELKAMTIQKLENFIFYKEILSKADIINTSFGTWLNGANQWILNTGNNFMTILFKLIFVYFFICCLCLVASLIHSIILQLKLNKLIPFLQNVAKILSD